MTDQQQAEERERWECRNDQHEETEEQELEREFWEPKHRFMSLRELEDVD